MIIKLNNPNRIMIVDDSKLDLMVCKKVIKRTTLFNDIISFAFADQALDYIIDNLNNKDLLPDFILLDLYMSDMDGFSFLQAYRKLPGWFKASCVIAILTSSDDVGDLKRAEANINVSKLLKKPLMVEEFKAVVNEFYDFGQ